MESMNMKTSAGIWVSGLTLLFFLVASAATPQTSGARKNANMPNPGPPSTMALDSLDGLEIQAVRENGVDPVKVKSDVATYRGRRAVHMLSDDSVIAKGNPSGGQSLAVVKGSDFKD